MGKVCLDNRTTHVILLLSIIILSCSYSVLLSCHALTQYYYLVMLSLKIILWILLHLMHPYRLYVASQRFVQIKIDGFMKHSSFYLTSANNVL